MIKFLLLILSYYELPNFNDSTNLHTPYRQVQVSIKVKSPLDNATFGYVCDSWLQNKTCICWSLGDTHDLRSLCLPLLPSSRRGSLLHVR